MPLTNGSQFACDYTVSFVLPFYLRFLIESYAMLSPLFVEIVSPPATLLARPSSLLNPFVH